MDLPLQTPRKQAPDEGCSVEHGAWGAQGSPLGRPLFRGASRLRVGTCASLRGGGRGPPGAWQPRPQRAVWGSCPRCATVKGRAGGHEHQGLTCLGPRGAGGRVLVPTGGPRAGRQWDLERKEVVRLREPGRAGRGRAGQASPGGGPPWEGRGAAPRVIHGTAPAPRLTALESPVTTAGWRRSGGDFRIVQSMQRARPAAKRSRREGGGSAPGALLLMGPSPWWRRLSPTGQQTPALVRFPPRVWP